MERKLSKNMRPEHKLTNYEVVLASILFLMTRYARQPDIRVAKAIEEHLDLLANHVDQDSTFIINTCARLKKQRRDIHTTSNDSRDSNLTSHKSLTNTFIH